MTRTDIEALKLAVAQARSESPERAQQIDAKLAEGPWEEAAMFAAYVCQTTSLRLKPWQVPPCMMDEDDPDIDDPDADDVMDIRQAGKLLRRMLAAGVSRWHPDPIAAMEIA